MPDFNGQMRDRNGPLPYYADDRPILLWLHGVGEGYNNNKDDTPGDESHANLFKQGIPKYLAQAELLASLEPDHPLRSGRFTVIAPQLPNRPTLWDAIVDHVRQILTRHGWPGAPLYIMGFSKGGLGAFQLARTLGARAMVTIDASPMAQPAREAVAQWVTPADRGPLPPYWAIYTGYAEREDLRRVQDFNDQLPEPSHAVGLDMAEPTVSARVRSLVEVPGQYTRTASDAPEDARKKMIGQHVWICETVTKGATPYRWLLRH